MCRTKTQKSMCGLQQVLNLTTAMVKYKFKALKVKIVSKNPQDFKSRI